MSNIKVVSINWTKVSRVARVSRGTIYRWRENRESCSVASDNAIRNALLRLYNITLQEFNQTT